MAEWYRANYRPELFNPEVPLELPPVRVPVRYLHAEQDPAFVSEMATGSGEFVDAEYDEQIVAGTTHWMVHERPGEIARLVREWVEKD
jgi:pimeloyl-ACP methyl ester carboxylesterase